MLTFNSDAELGRLIRDSAMSAAPPDSLTQRDRSWRVFGFMVLL
jgi:hypothetical protein